MIDEHIESIRQKYERLEGWLAPFPWCEDFQFHLNDIYTRLLMVSRGKKARGTGIESVVEMAEIFKPHEECKQPKKVLIEGNPGMGKTTYCNKVAYDWATKKHSAEGCFPKFDLVLMLKCRDVGRNSDLWEAIDDQLLPREVQKEERDTLFEFIRQNQSKILLILDGLDELPTGRLPEFAEIIQGKMLPLCHLVVTARQEAGIPVRNVCDTLLEIKGFTPGDAIQFILKFFSGKEELVEALFHRLLEDTSLQHMIANPLHTALLCLLCEDFDGILPERITQLYSEIVQCVLRRYRKKKGLTVDDEDPIEIYEDQLKHLGSIALNGLRENNMYFDNKRLGSGYSDLPGFGFLSVQPGSSKRRPCLCYGFTHKSFQEFFAGHYLCCQLVSKEISPEEVVADMRYFGELRQVLQFASGLLAVRSEESVASLINSITNEVNAMEEEELIEYYLPVALECIKECEKGSSNYHLELARTFGLCLKVKEADLKNQQIGDATAVVFGAALETNTTLSDLDLSYNNLRLAAAESLAAALEINATLTYLNLSYNELGPSGAESLARAFERNTSLTILDLSYNGLGPAGADYLASALKTNTTLTNLTVSGNCLGPAGAESFASALITNTSLTNLDLSGNNIGPVGIESLSVALKTNATMTYLVLSANKLGPVDADLLVAALETNKTLEYLKLSHNDLGLAGAKSLSGALETNATLKLLDLSYNDVGSAGARSLSTALETNRALTLLDLSYNDVGPSGAESLAAMLKVNTTLTLLNLCFNDLGSSIELFVDALHVNSTIDFLLLSAKNAGESVRSKLKEAHGTRLTVF